MRHLSTRWRDVATVALGGLLLADVALWASGTHPARLLAGMERLCHLAPDEMLLAITIVSGAICLFVRLLDRVGREQLAIALAGREEEARAVRRMALRDPLTELLNRRGLEAVFAQPVPDGAGRAVILCDLDGFKHVNDTLGHAAGDAILRRFADRLSGLHMVGAEASHVRLGGDEFVILVTARDVVDCAVRMAQSITGMIEQAEESWPVSVSIGIVQADPASRLDELLIAADTAMYDAKRSGEPFRVFNAGGHSTQREPNRIFERQLAITKACPDRSFFVVALGIDGFRRVRRAHGNGVCGKLVRELQRRLEQMDVVAVERMAPDTFGILIEAADIAVAGSFLDGLCQRLNLRVDVASLALNVTVSAGLSGPAPAGALRQHAELAQAALDEAWRTGQAKVVHDAVRQAELSVNRALMLELDDALASDRLDVHYQPKLCAKTNQVDSLEALVRWNHPTLGEIPPGRFVTVAEETGHIRTMTDWVLDRVIEDQGRLAEAGVTKPIYINISAQLICEKSFIAHLLCRLDGRADAIGIEITETAVLTNPEHALRHLHDLAAAGVSIAIDDYGVGLSSLAYLKQLPAKELKIDMLFISDLADSNRDPMIVRSTIDLAHGLGLRVTAEGVENPMTLALLRVMGCDLLQGYEISRPLPVAALISYLRVNSSAGEVVLTPFSADYGLAAAA